MTEITGYRYDIPRKYAKSWDIADLNKMKAPKLQIAMDEAIAAFIYPQDTLSHEVMQGDGWGHLAIFKNGELIGGNHVALRHIFFLLKESLKDGLSRSQRDAPKPRRRKKTTDAA